jgi:hypothetical protein
MTRKTKTTKTSRKTKTTRSVVPAEYRDRYRPGSRGDALAVRLKKFTTSADGTVDGAKLRARAEANGVKIVWG